MDLIKENLVKKRSVYRAETFIRKYWHDKTLRWVKSHAIRVALVIPDYVIDVGIDCTGPYMDTYILPGQPADTFDHTDEFIRKIYEFCLQNIKDTKPYVHGDWVLSNMIIDGNIIRLCDWDNLGIYTRADIMKKLRSDMISAFGDRFLEVINDSAGV